MVMNTFSGNIYEARRMILGCTDGEEKVVASIPPTYLITSTDPAFTFRNIKTVFFPSLAYSFINWKVFCQYPMLHRSTQSITADLGTRLQRHLLPSVQHHPMAILICLYQLVTAVFHQDSIRDHRRLTVCLPLFNATRFLPKICKPLMLIRPTCTLTCTPTCASKVSLRILTSPIIS